MKIDKHGLTIRGLKAASGKTYNEPRYSDWHHDVMYNRETGEVWTDNIYGRNTWQEYNDPSIVRLVKTDRHLTMQDIADEVHRYLLWVKDWA